MNMRDKFAKSNDVFFFFEITFKRKYKYHWQFLRILNWIIFICHEFTAAQRFLQQAKTMGLNYEKVSY